MKTKNTLFSICLALFLLHQVGYGQDGEYLVVQDLETWSSAQLNYEPNDNWKLGLEGQLRLDKNSTEMQSFFTELSAESKLNKYFSLTGGVRYQNKIDNEGSKQGSDHYLRYFLDGEFQHGLKRFDFKYRLRYTNRNQLGITIADGEIPVQYFRFKTSVGYNIKGWKLDPKVAGEIFNRYEKGGDDNGFDAFRLTGGTDYKIKGFGKVGLAYRMERELTDYYPKTTNIVLVSYSYTIKNKSKEND